MLVKVSWQEFLPWLIQQKKLGAEVINYDGEKQTTIRLGNQNIGFVLTDNKTITAKYYIVRDNTP